MEFGKSRKNYSRPSVSYIGTSGSPCFNTFHHNSTTLPQTSQSPNSLRLIDPAFTKHTENSSTPTLSTNPPNMSCGINPTVPDLLRAKMPVSDERLQSELRSLNKSIRYHFTQSLRQLLNRNTVHPAAIPSTKKLGRLAGEREMVLQAINDRLALALDAIRRDNRASTDVPGSWPSWA
jgi:hypothetical protein